MTLMRVRPTPRRVLTSVKSLNQELEILLALVCESIAEFRHYDVLKIAVAVGRSRSEGRSGTWAYVVPLRYTGGKAFRRGQRRGQVGYYSYDCKGISERRPDARYLMTVLFPRFFRLSPRERLETLVHELYHLHPQMRGDLRRFARPHVHHGPTPAAYQRKVEELTQEALENFPQLALHRLLCGADQEFEAHRGHTLRIPRRIFRLGPVPEELLGLTRSKPPITQVAPGLPRGTFHQKLPRDPAPLPRSPEMPAQVAAARDAPRPGPPPRSAEPRQLWLLWTTVAVLLAGALWANLAAAQSLGRGRATRPLAIFAEASPSATKVASLPRNAELGIVRLSSNKRWALVRSGDVQGWAPVTWIAMSGVRSGGAASGGGPPSTSASVGATQGSTAPARARAAGAAAQFGLDGVGAADFDVPPGEALPVEKPRAVPAARAKSAPSASGASPNASGAPGNVSPEDGLNSDENFVAGDAKDAALASFDQSAERWVSRRAGRLFEKPTPYSPRFAVIEARDEMTVLEKSPVGRWVRVRLKITGEEGWFPLAWIEHRKPSRLDRAGPIALQAYGAFGSQGMRTGWGGAVGYNFLSAGLNGRPRDRFELSLDYARWSGESLTQGSYQFASSFVSFALVGRYLASSDSGYAALLLEGGLMQSAVAISSTGTDADVLASLGLRDGEKLNGLLAGVGGALNFAPAFGAEAGVRVHFCSRTAVIVRAGLVLRF